MNKLLCVMLLTFITSCVTAQSASEEFRKGVPKVEFCDILEHVDELIYIECTYSGVEEYWSISGKESCKPELNMELSFNNASNSVPNKYLKQFLEVHKNYSNTYLELKLVGKFDDTEQASGHLGSNNSNFITEEIVELIVIKTKPNNR